MLTGEAKMNLEGGRGGAAKERWHASGVRARADMDVVTVVEMVSMVQLTIEAVVGFMLVVYTLMSAAGSLTTEAEAQLVVPLEASLGWRPEGPAGSPAELEDKRRRTSGALANNYEELKATEDVSAPVKMSDYLGELRQKFNDYLIVPSS